MVEFGAGCEIIVGVQLDEVLELFRWLPGGFHELLGLCTGGQKGQKRPKMTKKLQNSYFLVNLIRRTKMSFQFTQLYLMELGYAEKRPAKAVGVSKDPKNGQKKGKK